MQHRSEVVWRVGYKRDDLGRTGRCSTDDDDARNSLERGAWLGEKWSSMIPPPLPPQAAPYPP